MQAVAQLEALLHDQPHNPMRPNVVQDYQEELQRLRDHASSPIYVGGDRTKSRKRALEIERLLSTQLPKPIEEPIRKNQVNQLAHEVLRDVIRPAMLTRAQMARNPAGAVDHFLKHENSKPIKRAILAWKRAMWALDPTTTDRDHTNLERFRSEGTYGQAATFMADAQLPGNFGMTPLARENWPLGEATADTALKQAQRVEEAAVAQLEEPVPAVDPTADARARRRAGLVKARNAKWRKKREQTIAEAALARAAAENTTPGG